MSVLWRSMNYTCSPCYPSAFRDHRSFPTSTTDRAAIRATFVSRRVESFCIIYRHLLLFSHSFVLPLFLFSSLSSLFSLDRAVLWTVTESTSVIPKMFPTSIHASFNKYICQQPSLELDFNKVIIVSCYRASRELNMQSPSTLASLNPLFFYFITKRVRGRDNAFVDLPSLAFRPYELGSSPRRGMYPNGNFGSTR